VNCQSIRNKYFEIRFILEYLNLDILCLSETWLKAGDELPDFVGYNFFPGPLILRGRGVAILVRTKFKASQYLHNLSDISSNVEVLSLKVQYQFNKNLIVSSIYRRPEYTCPDLKRDNNLFFHLFSELVQCNCPFYALGDFNLRNEFIKPLNGILSSYKLTQIIDEPTRENNILDLIITNSISSIQSHLVSNYCLADHNLISCVVKIGKTKRLKQTITYRAFKSINESNFINDLNNKLSQPDSPTLPSLTKLNLLTDSLLQVFDAHAPVISTSFYKRHKKIFVSPDTKILISRRNSIYKKMKKNPTDYGLSCSFKLLKRQVKMQILHDSKSEFDRLVKSSNLWNAIRKLYPTSKQNKPSTAVFSADDINDFYVSISMPDDNSVHHALPVPPIPIQSLIIRTPLFNFKEIQVSTLLSAWKSFKNPLSTTLDTMQISPRMVDYSLKSENFASCLTNFYNSCISSCKIPQALKRSKVIPIPKIPNATLPNDLRPISIQPVLLKLFEKCIVPQLVSHLEVNNLISPQQYGFRKNHSTHHALLNITNYIQSSLRKNHVCFMIVLDFKKAFDKVDKSVLSHKLKWYNIDSKLIDSLLSNREQCVCVNCGGKLNYSKYSELYLGVPQGSCISCFLFNLMINDLPYILKFCDPSLFADDTSLLRSCPLNQLSNTLDKIEQDLQAVVNWLKSSRLLMNFDKVCFITFGNFKNVDVSTIKIRMNETELKRVDCVKILGLSIDDKLNWLKHLDNVTKKCNLALSPLYPLRNILSYKTKKMIVNSMVLSKLYYAACLWFDSSSHVKHKINNILRRCARFVLGKAKYDSVSHEFNNELEWLNCKYRFKFECTKLAFLFLHNMCPNNFKDFLNLDSINSTTTRAHTHYYNAIKTRSLREVMSVEWLKLPVDLRNVVSYNVFKTKLYVYLLNNQKMELPENEDNICNYSCIDSVINNV